MLGITFSAEAETADSQAFQISTKNDIPLHFSTNFFCTTCGYCE